MKNSLFLDFDHSVSHAVFEKLIKSLAKLLLKSDVNFIELIELLKTEYILEAYKICGSKGRTKLKTGISHRQIDYVLNQTKKTPYKDKKIDLLIEGLRELSDKSDNGLIHKREFTTLAENVKALNGHFYERSLLDELKSRGVIEEDEMFIKFRHEIYKEKPDKEMLYRTISKHFQRYLSTQFHNDETELKVDKYIDRAVLSTQISPEKYKEISPSIQVMLRAVLENIFELFVENDEEVPPGTYKEIGVSITEFNLNQNNEE